MLNITQSMPSKSKFPPLHPKSMEDIMQHVLYGNISRCLTTTRYKVCMRTCPKQSPDLVTQTKRETYSVFNQGVKSRVDFLTDQW